MVAVALQNASQQLMVNAIAIRRRDGSVQRSQTQKKGTSVPLPCVERDKEKKIAKNAHKTRVKNINQKKKQRGSRFDHVLFPTL